MSDDNDTKTRSTLTHLECSMCSKRYDADTLQNMCTECQRPLLARYDINKAKETLTRSSLAGALTGGAIAIADATKSRSSTLWRYEEMLPIRDWKYQLSLGREGWTPLMQVPMKRLKQTGVLSEALSVSDAELPTLWVKDESTNPTGSFKARGLSVAVSRAFENGAKALSVPSAGNAAGAMSAYAALAGLPAYVYMPKDVPSCFQTECHQLGAHVTLVDGLINDCGKQAKLENAQDNNRRFDVSTLKEPYRLEGKKTMGYELAEQFNWELPDVILYPTGGGTGLVGMWKAFEEMEQLGLLKPPDKTDDGEADSNENTQRRHYYRRPRMVSVQSTGCAPIVKAFHEQTKHATLWENAATVADGLRVPVAVGDFLILQALHESQGTAVAISDEDMISHTKLLGQLTGIFPAPEGAACFAAFLQLLEKGWIKPHETAVLFNTGTGLKYHHVYENNL